MASPILNFVSISGHKISAGYQNLPIGTQIVVVNKTSGETVKGVGAEIAIDNARLLIELPEGFPSGDFYLKAQDKAGNYLAQSVGFYVA